MISLTERQEKISQYLLASKKPVEIEKLSCVFNISTRSVYYDLKKIEIWAKVKNLSFQRFPKREVNLSPNSQIDEQPTSLWIASQETRRKAILFRLLMSPTFLTAVELSEAMEISRHTVIQDIKAIREEILPYGLKVVGLRSHGYIIQGEEISIRSFIAQLIFSNILIYDLISVLIKSNRSSDPDLLLDLTLSNLKLDEVKLAVKKASRQYEFWLPDVDYVRFIIYQAIALKRLEMGYELPKGKQPQKPIEEYEEYQVAQIVSSFLSDGFSLILSDEEVFNTFIMLLTCNIKTRKNAQKPDAPNKLLRKTVSEMIGAITPYTLFDKKAYRRLEHDLTEHLKLTLKQLQLGVVGENPILDRIKITYNQSFLLAEKMAEIFRESTGLTLPEGEVGYIALHVAVYLEVGGKAEDALTAVVICNAGKGAANILSKKLRIHLPELQIKRTCSILDLEESPEILEDVDLIISTINYTNNLKPVLKISPLLSDHEIAIIKEFINNKAHLETGGDNNRSDSLVLHNLYNRLAKRTDTETVNIFREEVERIGLFWNEEFLLDLRLKNDELQQSSVTALVYLEAMNMLKELNGIGVDPSEEETIGLLIHLIMAVGRWQKGEFAKEPNPEEFKSVAPETWAMVVSFLKRAKQHLGKEIPEDECVSVMRYLI